MSMTDTIWFNLISGRRSSVLRACQCIERVKPGSMSALIKKVSDPTSKVFYLRSHRILITIEIKIKGYLGVAKEEKQYYFALHVLKYTGTQLQKFN